MMKLYFIFFISIYRIIDNLFVFNRELTNFIWKILECDIFKNETLNFKKEKNYVFCIYFYIIHFFRLTFACRINVQSVILWFRGYFV